MRQQQLPGIVFATLPERTDTINVKLDSSGRARRLFKFWLNAACPIEAAIGERLDNLKKRRQFTPVIRNSLKLFFSLLAGDVSILESLFPKVVERIRADAIADYTRKQPASADFEALIVELAQHVDNRLDAVQEAVTIAPQAPQRVLQPVAGGPVQMDVPQFDAPSADDDLELDLTVSVDQNAGARAADNFLAAMARLQEM